MTDGGGLAIRIRAAVAADIDSIVAIEQVAFSDPPWSRRSFVSLLDNPSVRFDAAVAAGSSAVVGYVVTWIAPDEADLANLAVAPGWRRQGVGRRLLESAIVRARTAGARALYLEVRESNAAARALYAARGFVVVGRRSGYYRRPAEDALVLRLDVERGALARVR